MDKVTDITLMAVTVAMNFTNDSGTYDSGAGPASLAIPVVYGFICLVGLLGNGLVILVILKEKQMLNTTTNVLIFNLSIADFLYLILCVPLTAADYVEKAWRYGQFMCKFSNYFLFVNVYASIYTLMFMSLDRYLAVVFPVKSMSWRKVRIAAKGLMVMWLVILSSLIPLMVYFRVEESESEPGVQHCRASFGADGRRTFIAFFFVTSYALPLIIISVAYLLLLLSLWRAVSPQGIINKDKKRIVRMVVILVAMFGICWLPIQVVLLCINFGDPRVTSTPVFTTFHLVANCMSYANSCVNPLLYALLSNNFRSSFLSFLSCHSRANSGEVSLSRQKRTNKTTTVVVNSPKLPDDLRKARQNPVQNLTEMTEMSDCNGGVCGRKLGKDLMNNEQEEVKVSLLHGNGRSPDVKNSINNDTNGKKNTNNKITNLQIRQVEDINDNSNAIEDYV